MTGWGGLRGVSLSMRTSSALRGAGVGVGGTSRAIVNRSGDESLRNVTPASALAIDRFGGGALDEEEGDERGSGDGGSDSDSGADEMAVQTVTSASTIRALSDAFREGVNLSDYCTLGVGGPARLLVEVHTEEELAAVLRYAADAVRTESGFWGKGG